MVDEMLKAHHLNLTPKKIA